MEWRRLHLSALQTAAVSIAGALITSCGFAAAYWLHDAVRAHRHLGWSMAAIFIPIIAGFVIGLNAQTDLTSGIAAERWPEQEIEFLRHLITSRWVTAFSLTCVLVFFLLTLLGLLSNKSHSAYSPVGWAFYAPGMSALWLRNSIAPPSSKAPSTPRLTSTSPLQSDHWGNT